MQYPLTLALSLILLAPGAAPASAQQGVARGPVSAPRDAELEKQSMHNLEVARYYFKKIGKKEKKVNKSTEDRLLEIRDTDPTFSKLDEVHFLLGEVYRRGGEPEKAAANLNKVVKDYPDSIFAAEAKKRIEELAAQTPRKKEN